MPPSKIIPIFLSHSSKDRELVNKFIDLLHLGLGLGNEYIYSSSTPGSKSKPGGKFKNDIKDNIENATIIFFLATSNFIKSQNCQIEAGAAWMNKKALTISLVLGNPANGMLSGEIQAVDICKGVDLDQLKNKVLEILSDLPKVTDERWNDKKEQFISFSRKYREKRYNKIKFLVLLSLFFLTIISFSAIHFSERNSIDVSERNFTIPLADFGDIDMKLNLHHSKRENDTCIANNFKELLPYISEINSAKGIPKNLEIIIVLTDSLLKNYDSATIAISKYLTIRTAETTPGDALIKPENSIVDWYSLGLDGDYEIFGQSLNHKNLLIKLNIKQ